MAFLNPLIAAFAVLGAVPIIIHLLNRRRFRIILWAAMEFLLSSLKKNKRRLQLRDIILMLIRAAAVILMALALARPTIAGGVLKLFGGGGRWARPSSSTTRSRWVSARGCASGSRRRKRSR